jgi:hypothetical protein
MRENLDVFSMIPSVEPAGRRFASLHRVLRGEFPCFNSTIKTLLVERGFRETLDGVKRELPPVKKRLSGEQEARIIATRLGSPPSGYANWTLRLLARKVVELGIAESVSYETVRWTLKKTG